MRMFCLGVNELNQLSWNERVAHYPEVGLGIRERLEDPEVLRNPEIFKESVYALAVIIDFEQRNKSPDSVELIEEIVNTNFSRIMSIINDNPDFLGYRTLFFLGRSGKIEAVDFIFEWIRNNPEKAQRELYNLASALGKQNLYKKYESQISQHLDDLMRTRDKTLLQTAKNLDKIIRLRM